MARSRGLARAPPRRREGAVHSHRSAATCSLSQAMPPPGSCMPPVKHTPRSPPGTVPPPPTVLESLKAIKAGQSTVDTLKADPNLTSALRRLRASTEAGRAAAAQPVIVSKSDVSYIPANVSTRLIMRDPALREALSSLRARTGELKLGRECHKFSAVGELTKPRATGSVPSDWDAAGVPAGKQTIAAIGPGWVGPHRLMESYRRPTGPGKR